jgi:hypothetical protein
MSAALPSTDISKRRMIDERGGGGDLFFLLYIRGRIQLSSFLSFFL